MFSILIKLLLAIHVIVSLLIILVVLMQRPKNEGLGAAFGGGMTDNLFGAQTTNVLAKFTRWLGGLFFLLTLSLSVLYARQSSQETAVRERLMATPAVESSEAAAPEAPAPSSDASPISPAPAEASEPVELETAQPEASPAS